MSSMTYSLPANLRKISLIPQFRLLITESSETTRHWQRARESKKKEFVEKRKLKRKKG